MKVYATELNFEYNDQRMKIIPNEAKPNWTGSEI